MLVMVKETILNDTAVRREQSTIRFRDKTELIEDPSVYSLYFEILGPMDFTRSVASDYFSYQ